jgi:hypothetical protein
VLRIVAHYMAKINWSCASCGMSSARRTSVVRHIDNPNIHGGEGKILPFTEYVAGRREGKYRVGQKPQFASSEQPLLIRLIHKIRLEMENEIAKEVAKRICSRVMDDSIYSIIENAAEKRIWLKQFDEVFRQNP